jgi:hypothetical protein
MIWRCRSRQQGRQARSRRFGRMLLLACLALLAAGGGYASAVGPAPIPAPPGRSLHPETVPLRPTAAPRREPAQPSHSTPQRSASSSGSSSTSADVSSTEEKTEPVAARTAPPAHPRQSSRSGRSTRKAARGSARREPRISAKPKLAPAKPTPARSNRSAAPAVSAKPATSPDRSLLLAGGLLLVAFVFGRVALLVLSGPAAMSANGDEGLPPSSRSRRRRVAAP